MSLIEDRMEDCELLSRPGTPDSLGGYLTEYSVASTFKAATVKNSSAVERVAERQGAKESYTVFVHKGTPLAFHDVIRRVSDGLTLMCTSNIRDRHTPDSAGLNYADVQAEVYRIEEET